MRRSWRERVDFVIYAWNGVAYLDDVGCIEVIPLLREFIALADPEREGPSPTLEALRGEVGPDEGGGPILL